MKIAVPMTNGRLSAHFGHCEKFIIFEVDAATQEIFNEKELTPPPHEPGLLPAWLAEQQAEVIIAGGMGQRAQNLFVQNGIKVETGALELSPRELVISYLKQELVTGANFCDH